MKIPCLFWLVALPLVAAPLRVTNLRCDSSLDPLGIDAPQPRLSWELRSDENAKKQTAWQIRAAASRAALEGDRGDLWDSGKVMSSETARVPYAGAKLSSSQQVFWQAR